MNVEVCRDQWVQDVAYVNHVREYLKLSKAYERPQASATAMVKGTAAPKAKGKAKAARKAKAKAAA